MTDAEKIAHLEAQVAVLSQALAEALALVEQLRVRVAELEAQVGQDSHNSHWPSSRDKGRRQKNKSLRQASGKQPGGQAGHAGQTLKLVATPERVVVHWPEVCAGCGSALVGAAGEQPVVLAAERRQVFDVPPVQLEATEHRLGCVTCPACGDTSRGAFPAAVSQPVQYGPRVKAFSVYLHQQQLLPLKRLCALLCEWWQAPVSPGSVVNWVQQAAALVTPQVERIKAGLRQAPVVHCDETGHYIGGRRVWLHVAATPELTCYQPHAVRGGAGISALGVLPGYQGVAVHDGFASYARYDCRHALCNVHHLRELTAVHEQFHQPWAAAFKSLLCELKAEVEQARSTQATALTPHRRAAIADHYQRLLDKAYAANAPPPTGWPTGKRGRPRQPKPLNLAQRLDRHRAQVLAFVDDFQVPFDNNLVERDIRMVKVQQKISGCFRSRQGANAAAALRSYLSTLSKQGHSASHVLLDLFAGHVLVPLTQPE